MIKHTLGTSKLELRKSLLAIVLSLVIVFSFVAVIQLEKNSFLSNSAISPLTSNLGWNHFGFLSYSSLTHYAQTFSGGQIVLEDIVKESPDSFINNSTTRTAVYDFIVANPGIQFRGICSGLSIAIGTAEFHLGVLKRAGLISFLRDGKYKRFFASKKFSIKEMKLISLLRHETVREILKTLEAEKTVSHSKLASNLSITSQGLTWQMNRLREEKVIQEYSDGIKVIYSLSEVYVQALPHLLCVIEQ